MIYAEIMHVGSRQWMLGIIENHQARPLTQDEANKKSLAALVRRNEISVGMSESLKRLADSADAIEDSKFWSRSITQGEPS